MPYINKQSVSEKRFVSSFAQNREFNGLIAERLNVPKVMVRVHNALQALHRQTRFSRRAPYTMAKALSLQLQDEQNQLHLHWPDAVVAHCVNTSAVPFLIL